jgi:hypothetical protein
MIYYLSGKALSVIECEDFTAFFCRTALADGPSRLETKPRDASRYLLSHDASSFSTSALF